MSKRLFEDVSEDGATGAELSKRSKPLHNSDIVATLKKGKANGSATDIANDGEEAVEAKSKNGHVTVVVQNGGTAQNNNDEKPAESQINSVSEANGVESNNHGLLKTITNSTAETAQAPISEQVETPAKSDVSSSKKPKVDATQSPSDEERAAAERMFNSGSQPADDGAVAGSSRDANDNSQSLVGFQQTRILMNDPKSKRVHVLGKFKDDDEDAIVTMVKTPFSEESVSKILSNETTLRDDEDQYGSCSAITTPVHNSINTQIIKPASSRHIMKYTERRPFLIFETPEVYEEVTKPWLESHRYGVQWVYNILEHKQESDRIQFEDPDKKNGFVLIPCVKWDMKQVEDLFMIALVQRRDLECLRDLNAEHLPLLKNILNKGMETITTNYNLKSSQIRAYIHYLPSYEHFHVNFSHLMHDSGGVQTEKAHLLNDVIYNIENISSDFYEKRTLPVKLYEGDPLLGLLFSAVGMF